MCNAGAGLHCGFVLLSIFITRPVQGLFLLEFTMNQTAQKLENLINEVKQEQQAQEIDIAIRMAQIMREVIRKQFINKASDSE